MAQVEHLSKLNQNNAGKGVQLIGVSLDDNANELTKATQDKGISWPVAYDGGGWNGDIATKWGVNSIPQTFIIGPDSNILWRGLPSDLDAALDNAIKQHPPTATNVKQIAGMQTNKPGQNDAAAADAARAANDAQATEMAKKEKQAADALSQARTLWNKGQYVAAHTAVEKIPSQFEGTDAAADAIRDEAKYAADPEYKAEKALNAADPYQGTSPDKYRSLLQGIARDFGTTKAGKKAQDLLKALDNQ